MNDKLPVTVPCFTSPDSSSDQEPDTGSSRNDLIQDLTERVKKLEGENAELKKALEGRAADTIGKGDDQYRAIIAGSQAGYFMIDLEGLYQDVNDAWLSMHGYSSPDEVIGRHFSLTQVEDDQKQARELVDFLINGGKIPAGEFSRRRKDGSVGYHTFSITPVIRNGVVIGLEGFLIDSTDRKKLEEALRQSEMFLSGVLSSTPNLIYVYDLVDQCNIYANREVVQFLGYTPEEVRAMGSALFDIILHPDDREKVALHHAMMKEATDGELHECVYRMKHSDGTWRLLQSRDIVYSRDEQEQVRQILGSVNDITSQKDSEDSIREANQRIHLLTSLTRHDILNQVSAMDLLLDLAAVSPDPEKTREYIGHARDAGKKIEITIGFTREYEDFGTTISGWQLIHQIITSAQYHVVPGTAALEITIPEDLEIFADPIIRKVIAILLEYAHRSRDAVSLIRCSSEEHDDSLILVWEHDGPGVPIDEKDLIFEHSHGKNSGSGLFLAKEILSITGLSIRECGDPKAGVRFEIRVPAGKYRFGLSGRSPVTSSPMVRVDEIHEIPSPSYRNDPDIPPASPLVTGQGISILYVDDDLSLLNAGTRYLEEMYGFCVTPTGNAREALELASDQNFDAIISDYEMPGMTGLGLLKHLRASGDSTPFILLTGMGSEAVAIEALNCGADFYLQKGSDTRVRFDDLSNRIHYAVSRRRTEQELFESKKRIADIIDFLPYATFAISSDRKVIAWNRAMEEITGMSQEEILNHGDYRYAIPFYHKRRPILIDLAITPDDEIAKTYPVIHREGSRIHAELYIPHLNGGKGMYIWGIASPLYDSAGNISGAIESLHDITDRKLAEEALRESEEKYRLIFEYSPLGHISFDARGVITACNDEFVEIIGGLRDQIIGVDLLALPDVQVVTSVQDVLNGISSIREGIYSSITGNKKTYVRAFFTPISIGGQVIGGVGIVEDISARKRDEEELQFTNTLLMTLCESSIDGILVVDEEGKIILFNKRFVGMWEIPPDIISSRSNETVRQAVLDLCADPDEVLTRVRDIYLHRPEMSTDEIILRDGRTIDQYSTPLFGPDGTYYGRYWSYRDITRFKRQEESIRSYSLELERQNADLELVRKELATLNNDLEDRVRDRTAEVEALLRHKDQFIDMVGHDLKTPLTPLCALLPFLLKQEKDEDNREILTMLIRDAAYMRDHIDKVLLLARLNRMSPPADLTGIGVRPVVDNTLVTYGYGIREKDLIIENQISDDFQISMNCTHLEIMLANVIGNAIKYSKSGGTVIISGSESSDLVTLVISDTGIGMSHDEIEHIFDEFYRADSSRHERDSHGLGLSIVKKIVELYRGSIQAGSRGPGMGSTFTISLPRDPVT